MRLISWLFRFFAPKQSRAFMHFCCETNVFELFKMYVEADERLVEIKRLIHLDIALNANPWQPVTDRCKAMMELHEYHVSKIREHYGIQEIKQP